MKHPIHKRVFKNSWVQLVIGGTLLIFFVWTLWRYWYEKPAYVAPMGDEKIAINAEFVSALSEDEDAL